MGLPCSILWCNLYLHFFETRFLSRLAHLSPLNQPFHLSYCFWFFDDILWCRCNVDNPLSLLLGDKSIHPTSYISIDTSSTYFSVSPNGDSFGSFTKFLGTSLAISPITLSWSPNLTKPLSSPSKSPNISTTDLVIDPRIGAIKSLYHKFHQSSMDVTM